MTQYPNGMLDASLQGIITTTVGDQIFWWTYQKGTLGKKEGYSRNSGKTKVLGIISFYTNSQNLSCINVLIVVDKGEVDLDNQ